MEKSREASFQPEVPQPSPKGAASSPRPPLQHYIKTLMCVVYVFVYVVCGAPRSPARPPRPIPARPAIPPTRRIPRILPARPIPDAAPTNRGGLLPAPPRNRRAEEEGAPPLPGLREAPPVPPAQPGRASPALPAGHSHGRKRRQGRGGTRSGKLPSPLRLLSRMGPASQPASPAALRLRRLASAGAGPVSLAGLEVWGRRRRKEGRASRLGRPAGSHRLSFPCNGTKRLNLPKVKAKGALQMPCRSST